MRIIRDWRGLAADETGAAVALGNFDGVHRGHQAVIAAAREAADTGAPLGVVTFDPHPRRYFQPDAAPFRLMTAGQQARALASLGVDLLYVLPFDADMVAMSARTFAREVLSDGLGVAHVAAGFDFTFGAKRSGDANALRALGDEFGFGVSIAPPLADETGYKISSSAVRQALEQGHPERAADLLGRPFAIEGVVEEGRKLGRTLGFPTANVELGRYLRPRLGVYATRTRLADGRVVNGVANIGRNPAAGLVEPRLEVWLFDFDGDLYGQTIETELVAFQRPERDFDSLEALTAQVMADAEEARRILGRGA
jgi:riboflavin kinase/FMN adenylyltransferase